MCMYKYSRDALLKLRRSSSGIKHPIPSEIKKPFRGCRAGAKLKARRWRNKPFVPSIIMGNVNSLPNKCEELEALVRSDEAYLVSLYLLTESWLTDGIPDSAVSIPGYTLVRADRAVELCGKTKGGGLAVLVSNKWCHPGHITVKNKTCTRDVELLVVGIRPYYLPQEFSNVVAIVVYIPPRADPTSACDIIQERWRGSSLHIQRLSS
ncbi:hypothetical protein WMY93_033408 [Mugilogobius chulae]|uniref:Uncharacterized protein n=1 Tax=Mugilogobius chulae TaxID=88201 RepID=A0AAW0MHB7_9GOBI